MAQEPSDLRAPALGEARDAAGAPWVGAEVVLVSRAFPADADCGEVDRVTAVADARGRFRAPVLRGRAYSAWAQGAPGASGRAASAVVEDVFAQQPIVLRQSRVLPPRVVTLQHTDRWPGHTFQLRVVDELGNLDVHDVAVTGGRAALPPLAGAAATVEVLASAGGHEVPLVVRTLDAAVAELTIALPERRRILCWVVSDRDVPIANASVLRRLGTRAHLAGTTAPNGSLALDVAVPDGSGRPTVLFVDARGFAPGVCVEHVAGQGHEAPPGCGPGDQFCRVRAMPTTVVRVVGGDGAPLAGAQWLEQVLAANRPARGSGTWSSWRRAREADANGIAELVDRAFIALALRERDLAALPSAWRVGLHPAVTAALAGAVGSGTAADPQVLDLRRLCPIELTFTEPEGTPVRGVRIAVCPLEERTPHYGGWGEHGHPETDERGRVRMLVPAEQRLGIAAMRGMRLLVRAVEVGPSRRDAPPAVASFVLPPERGITGRVLDAAGAPLAGMQVSASFGTDNAPAAWRYATGGAVAADPSRPTLRVVLPTERSELLRLTMLGNCHVTSGADGTFRLPMADASLPGLLLFTRRPEQQFTFGGTHVPWLGEPIDGVELRAH